MSIKLRRGMSLGALDAANDQLLTEVFVDTGLLPRLRDSSDAAFLVLGRTGSGKTALLQQLGRDSEHCRALDPEALCMQYLHSSQILQYLTTLGINLDIFYKYLWRHVIVLELVRMRYGGAPEAPGLLLKIFSRKEAKAQAVAADYFKKHDGEFWITSEACVRNVVEELDTRLQTEMGAGFSSTPASATGRVASSQGYAKKSSSTETQRIQQIVSGALLADLNNAIEALERGAFEDEQQHYFLLVDDLDKNWMHDDQLYLDLLKSLLITVREMNARLRAVKIVVALRENIFRRTFAVPTHKGPQREKWQDSVVTVRWTREELRDMLGRRVAAVFRKEYTKEGATLSDLFPRAKKSRRTDGVDYILDRTLDRPRDLIQFSNAAIESAAARGKYAVLPWSAIEQTETTYSRQRLESIYDEWHDTFPSLPALVEPLRDMGPRFDFGAVDQGVLVKVFSHSAARDCPWIKMLQEEAMENVDGARVRFVSTLILAGLLGAKDGSDSIRYGWDEPPPEISIEACQRYSFHVHRAFHRVLGFLPE